jgi:hypothetical protein
MTLLSVVMALKIVFLILVVAEGRIYEHVKAIFLNVSGIHWIR